MRNPSRKILPVTALVLIVVACGGGTASTTTTVAPAATTTAAEAPGTTRSTGEVTLEAPTEVGLGTDFVVAWTGPDNDGDYVTIVPAGADEGAYTSYFDTAAGAEGTLVAPTEVGDYEIRYVDGASSQTVASIAITVIESAVTLDTVDEVEGGTEFEVTWTGPNGPGDFITVVAEGAGEAEYTSYFYTADGATGTVVAPVPVGDYEVRYVTGTNAVLASRPLIVTQYVVTLEAPATVEAGASFAVTWTGPNGPSDYITIAPADSPVGTYLNYQYTTEGSPLTLIAPDEPGAYEIRYASDRVPDLTFGSIPITVN
jgi:Ca-activated chloride channel family protein